MDPDSVLLDMYLPPGGTEAYILNMDGDILVYDLAAEIWVRNMTGSKRMAWCMVSNGKKIYTGGLMDDYVSCWDCQRGYQSEHHVRGKAVGAENISGTMVAVSWNLQRLVTCSRTHVQLWDESKLDAGPLHVLYREPRESSNLAIAIDGGLLAIGTDEKNRVLVWDLEKIALLHEIDLGPGLGAIMNFTGGILVRGGNNVDGSKSRFLWAYRVDPHKYELISAPAHTSSRPVSSLLRLHPLPSRLLYVCRDTANTFGIASADPEAPGLLVQWAVAGQGVFGIGVRDDTLYLGLFKGLLWVLRLA